MPAGIVFDKYKNTLLIITSITFAASLEALKHPHVSVSPPRDVCTVLAPTTQQFWLCQAAVALQFIFAAGLLWLNQHGLCVGEKNILRMAVSFPRANR